MKRNDRIVGIDGTAHGRMNSSDSHLIQVARLDEEARQHQRDHHLELMPMTRNASVLTIDRSEDRILDQLARSSPDGARATARSRPDTARRPGRRGRTARGGSGPTSATATMPCFAGPAGSGLARRVDTIVDTCRPPAQKLRAQRLARALSPLAGRAGGQSLAQPATCLMRAIISSVAFSGVQLSLTTRLIALAQTFSLLRIVNL